MLDMGHDFVDETLGIRREKAFWMPRNAGPASDRGITADQRPRQHARLLNRDRRWNDGDAVAGSRERDQRVGSSAFQKHLRSQMRVMTSLLKPKPRGEGAMQQQ